MADTESGLGLGAFFQTVAGGMEKDRERFLGLMFKNAQIRQEIEAKKQAELALGASPEQVGALYKTLGGQFEHLKPQQMTQPMFSTLAGIQKAQQAAVNRGSRQPMMTTEQLYASLLVSYPKLKRKDLPFEAGQLLPFSTLAMYNTLLGKGRGGEAIKGPMIAGVQLANQLNALEDTYDELTRRGVEGGPFKGRVRELFAKWGGGIDLDLDKASREPGSGERTLALLTQRGMDLVNSIEDIPTQALVRASIAQRINVIGSYSKAFGGNRPSDYDVKLSFIRTPGYEDVPEARKAIFGLAHKNLEADLDVFSGVAPMTARELGLGPKTETKIKPKEKTKSSQEAEDSANRVRARLRSRLNPGPKRE